MDYVLVYLFNFLLMDEVWPITQGYMNIDFAVFHATPEIKGLLRPLISFNNILKIHIAWHF